MDLPELRAATGKTRPSAEVGDKTVLNENMMEEMLRLDNLTEALKTVRRNKGAAGVDGIGVNELGAHLRAHWTGIQAKLVKGTYQPARCGALLCGGRSSQNPREDNESSASPPPWIA